MWDAVTHDDAHDLAVHAAGMHASPRGRSALDDAPWWGAVLDEVDYPMLLVGMQRELLYANAAARGSIACGGLLQVHDERVAACRATDEAALARALAGAVQRGTRCMLSLGDASAGVRVAVVPLRMSAPGRGPTPLLMLGRSTTCGALAIQCFALSHRLTPAETQVLLCLCSGDSPASIARRQGVALSTVRSHVGGIRAKTGTASIRALCEQVARLPPMVSALRAGTTAPLP